MAPAAPDDRPVLLYDGDCGFCTASVGFLRRRVEIARLQAQPWQRADLTQLPVSVEQCREAVQLVFPDGSRLAGAAAVAAVLRRARGWWPLLGRALQLPVVREIAEVGYRVVAAGRSRLPGGTPGCALPP